MQIVGSMLERISLSVELYISESSQIRELHETMNVLMKKSHIKCLVHLGKAFIIIRPCSLDNNTPNRPVLSA